jgi:hypothetical protein
MLKKRDRLDDLPASAKCAIGVCFGALVFVLQLATALGAEGSEPAVLTLSGTEWRIRPDLEGTGREQLLFEADTASPGWIPAVVPGNIQADLEAAHQLTPLW